MTKITVNKFLESMNNSTYVPLISSDKISKAFQTLSDSLIETTST